MKEHPPIGPEDKINEICVDAWQRALVDDSPVPQYGEALHRYALAASYNPRPTNVSDEYDLIKPEFDFAYYLSMYPGLSSKNLDPVSHYIRAGAREGRNPTPHFATKIYREHHADDIAKSGLTPFGHWIKGGKPDFPSPLFEHGDGLAALLGMSGQEASERHKATYDSIRDRLMWGELGKMVNLASEHDPLIAASWHKALGVQILPYTSDRVVSRVVLTHALQKSAQWTRARIVLLTSRSNTGLSRNRTEQLVDDMARRFTPQQVLVVDTDGTPRQPAHDFPAGVRVVSFGQLAGGVTTDLERALVELLRSLRPELIFNLDSDIFWRAVQLHGKVLADVARLVSQCPRTVFNHLGYATDGLPKQFYRHFDLLSGVCVDAAGTRAHLIDAFIIPPDQTDKICVVPLQASVPATAAKSRRKNARPQAFWAEQGRSLSHLASLYEIAVLLPDVDFRVWTSPGDRRRRVPLNARALRSQPANLILERPAHRLADIPLDEADFWIDTAADAQTYCTNLEVAVHGLPVVLLEGEAFGADPRNIVTRRDIAKAVESIRRITNDIPQAQATARARMADLCARHSPDAYRTALDEMFEHIGMEAAP